MNVSTTELVIICATALLVAFLATCAVVAISANRNSRPATGPDSGEPPIGTWLMDADGDAWRRTRSGWTKNGDPLVEGIPFAAVLTHEPLSIITHSAGVARGQR